MLNNLQPLSRPMNSKCPRPRTSSANNYPPWMSVPLDTLTLTWFTTWPRKSTKLSRRMRHKQRHPPRSTCPNSSHRNKLIKSFKRWTTAVCFLRTLPASKSNRRSPAGWRRSRRHSSQPSVTCLKAAKYCRNSSRVTRAGKRWKPATITSWTSHSSHLEYSRTTDKMRSIVACQRRPRLKSFLASCHCTMRMAQGEC